VGSPIVFLLSLRGGNTLLKTQPKESELCCEALGLEGADYARGYIQNWLYQGIRYNADALPEKSAQRIFRAADQILRAGRPRKEPPAEYAN
jgi:hypothetical protein